MFSTTVTLRTKHVKIHFHQYNVHSNSASIYAHVLSFATPDREMPINYFTSEEIISTWVGMMSSKETGVKKGERNRNFIGW